MDTISDNTSARKNTDRELWRERDGDYYADSIHVTEGGRIGINCGGHVIVMPIRNWFALANRFTESKCIGQAFGFERCIGKCRDPKDCSGSPLIK